MVVKFITLKWGTKYGPEYVNRLYNCIKKTYSGDFKFYCYTDDDSYLNSSICIENITNLPHYDSNLFTFVKIDLLSGLPFEGPYVFLDLDVLVLKDLKLYFDEYNFKEPRIGYCYWTDPSRIFNSYHRGDCYVNSSLLTWNNDQFKYVYDTYIENKTIVDYKFKTFDKFIFYFCDMKYHPEDVMYSYNASTKEKLNYYMTIFNTSNGKGTELHDSTGWAKQYWESFSKT